MFEEIEKNSFQRLMEDEYESRFTLPQMLEVEHCIQKKQNSYRVTGDMIDLFFPKIIKTIVGLLGGDDSDDTYRTNAPSDSGSPYKPSSPRAPGNRK